MKQEIETSHNKHVCSTEYMRDSLCFFDLETVEKWQTALVNIDAIISTTIENNIDQITQNQGRLPEKLKEQLALSIQHLQINADEILKNLEAFHGYRAYAFPDNGKILKEIKKVLPNSDPYYGIAFADLLGYPHVHREGPAFNRVMSGKGVFTGLPSDEGKFERYYHGSHLEKGLELEIPAGMTHGHLVKQDASEPFSFFFMQLCGFRPEMGCQGDFERTENYDLTQFGVGYK